MFSNFIGFVYVGGDPPKSPLIRGTLTEFSPLNKGGWGGSKGLKTQPVGLGKLTQNSVRAGFEQKLSLPSEKRSLNLPLQTRNFFACLPQVGWASSPPEIIASGCKYSTRSIFSSRPERMSSIGEPQSGQAYWMPISGRYSLEQRSQKAINGVS